MPRSYKRKRTYRRRPYAKRRKYSRNTMARTFKRAMGGTKPAYWRNKLLPDTLYIKMPWTTYYQFTGTNYSNNMFRANSVYDPDYTSVTNNQPPLFDDISNMYQNYQVVASKCKVTFINSASLPATVYVYPTTQTTDNNFTGDGTYKIENQQYAKHALVAGGLGSKNTVTISSFMSTSKVFGYSKNAADDIGFMATGSGNPAQQWYWSVGAYDYSTIDTPLNILAKVQLTYYVKWSKRYTQSDD